MDKLVFNCTTREIEKVAFTAEEIVQREYEASLPIPVQPPATEERLLAAEEAINLLLGL